MPAPFSRRLRPGDRASSQFTLPDRKASVRLEASDIWISASRPLRRNGRPKEMLLSA